MEGYNSYKKNKKLILNREMLGNDLLEEAKKYFFEALMWFVSALILGAAMVTMTVMWSFSAMAENSIASFIFWEAMVCAVLLGGGSVVFLIVSTVKFIVVGVDISKIKKGHFKTAEYKMDYKTVEYRYKLMGKHIREISEYILYFPDNIRYIDNDAEHGIYNKADAEDVFYLAYVEGKKSRYIRIYEKKHYEWIE